MDVLLEPTCADLAYWDRILKALESGSAAERIDAESELLRSGVSAAHVIYQLIGTKSARVQEITACLLAGAGDAVLESLFPLASASDPGGSKWAASVLGKLKDERALPALTRALFVGNQRAGEALTSFGEAGAESICTYVNGLGSGEARAELDQFCSHGNSRPSDPSPDGWEILIRIGEPAVRPLANLLRHEHQEVVRAASDALLQIGGKAWGALQAALADAGIKNRQVIIQTFRSHPGPWMVIPLCKLLAESTGAVRFDASEILQELDEEVVQAGTVEPEAGRLIPGLCRVLCDDEKTLSPPSSSLLAASEVHEAAILSRRSAAAVVLLQFPTDVVRAEMEREIDPSLCHRLISVMSSSVESVAEAAFRVLWTLGSLAADHLVQSLRDELARSSRTDGVSDSQAILRLWLLVNCGDPRATELLCESLTSGSSQFRGSGFYSKVIEMLGQMKDARAVTVLIEYLESVSADVRLAAVESLGQIGHRSALPALHRLLSFGLTWGDPIVHGNWADRFLTTQVLTYDPDPQVRAAVKQAITLIEQTPPEIANCPIPAMPPSDLGSSSLPRPVE
jgi:HEAT repeat protein